ncbi:MAG: sigma-70 family RNA polymerase sigma factor [bacterium]|nr:sigma-70 family RNA polymerase sigma factor [bacterium]
MTIGPQVTDPEALLAGAGWLRALAARLIADPGTQDDLAQETALASWQRRGESLGPGWVARVLRSRLRDGRQAAARRARREAVVAREEAQLDTAEVAARLELQQLVVDVVQSLDEPYRSTVVLRWFEDLAPAEIARRSGLPAGTVRWRLHRAHELLREEFDRRSGDRASWVAALTPLALPSVEVATGGAGAAYTGAIVGLKSWMMVTTLVLVAVGASWIWAPDPGGAPSVAPGPEVGGEAALEGAVSIDDVGEASEAALAAQGLDDDRRAAGRFIVGTVHVADGPLDDLGIEVLALHESRDYAELAPLLERARWDQGAARTLDRLLLARAPVSRLGEFELSLGERVDQVHLALRGDLLWAPATTRAVPGVPVELEAQRGARLRGHLIAPGGAPAAGVQLQVSAGVEGVDPPHLFDLAAATDAAGAFDLRGLPAGTGYTLVAFPIGLAGALRRSPSLRPGETHRLTIELDTGGTVRGEVVDGADAPMPGASVEALLLDGPFGGASHTVRTVVADEDGRFELAHVPAGEVALRARFPGRLETGRERVEVPLGGEAEARLVLGDGYTVRGRVSWAGGAPARGVVVRAGFDPAFARGMRALGALRGAEGRATSAADGSFVITGLGSGPFIVQAEEQRDGAPHRARQEAIDPEQEDEPLVLVLQPPLALKGQVVDTDGAPVRDFRVRAVRTASGDGFPVATQQITERVQDPRGRFELPGLIAGPWRLEVAAPAFGTPPAVTVHLPQAAPLELTLAAAARASGVVVDGDGYAVPGARVRVDDGRGEQEVARSGLPAGPSVTTDAEGRFSLDALPAGDYALAAAADGFVSSSSEALRLEPGYAVEGIRLILTRGGRVTGEVWGDDGLVAGHRVILIRFGDTTGATSLQTVSDGGGLFSFDAVPPNLWVLAAIDPSANVVGDDSTSTAARLMGAAKFAQVNIEEGEHEHVILGTARTDGIDVHGSLTRLGAGVPERSIAFHPGRGAMLRGVVRCMTGDEGRFHLQLPRSGEYLVVVESPSPDPTRMRATEFRLAIDERSPVELELPAGRLAGLIQTADGAPARGAPIVLVPAVPARTDRIHNGQTAYLTSDHEGRFEVDELGPGEYVLQVGGRVFTVPDVRFARVRQLVTLGAGEERDDLIVTLPDPASARVQVVDADGQPVSGATVYARAADGELLDTLSLELTDALGFVRCAGLPPGELRFSARDRKRSSAESQLVRVGPGASAELRLTLVAATKIQVHLRNAGGPSGGSVRVLDGDGHEFGARYTMADYQDWSDSQQVDPSEYWSGPLPPGRYRVVASDGARSAERELTVNGEPVRELTLVLE